MFEVFFQEILDLSCIYNPRSDGFFGLLFFLDEDFGCIDFLLLKFVGFDTFVDFGLSFFLFFEILLDVNESIISQLFVIVNFGGLLDLDKRDNYLRFWLLFFGLLFALFEVFEFHWDWRWSERYNSGSSTKNSIYEINVAFLYFASLLC